MYISQNLRQSWYGNLLGDEDNDEDQDTIKVCTIYIFIHFHFLFFLACTGRNEYISTCNDYGCITCTYSFRNISI